MARRILIAPGVARRAALLLSGVALLILSGCGVAETGNFDRGQQLFAAKCASCHALKDAGSTAQVGPDLDAAFAQARASGMDADTIAGVVKAQVESPRPGVGPSPNPSVTMPAGLVSGEDLDDVATYVADVAGKPGIKGPQLPNDPGAQVFADNQCSGCHTLAAADASGTTGPDLDNVIPGMSAAEVMKSIVDPNAKISSGYPPNVMPDTFGKSISSQDLKDLVSFMLKYAGKQAKG